MKVALRATIACSVATVVIGLSAPAQAGPYSDALAMCLVKSTTTQDKTTLVQWMFAMASLHPDVSRLSAATAADRSELNKKFAGLVEGLLTRSCVSEAKTAVRYEGPGTIETSFTVLGQVASRELFTNPAVAAGMADMNKDFDAKKLKDTLGVQ